jgi:branched-chain amino acid transport system substrate-binding protein
MRVSRIDLGGAREQLERHIDLAARGGDRSGQAQHFGVVWISALGALERGLGPRQVASLEKLPPALDRVALVRHAQTITPFAWADPRRYSRPVLTQGRSVRATAALLLALAAAAVLTGCPGRTKRNVGVNMPVPTDGDQQALRRFEETRARFLRDGGGAQQARSATSEFEAIARDFPDDPIAPHALLFAGMAALGAGQYDRAADNLQDLVRDTAIDANVRSRAKLFYGITLGYQGRHKRALAQLDEARSALDTENKDEQAAYLAAVAESSAATGRLPAAIAAYDSWHAVGRASERAYVVSRIRSLVDQLDEAAVRRTYDQLASKEGPGAALVGARLAAQLDARGDRDGAEQVRNEAAEAREESGLGDGMRAGEGAGGDPARVGAILSLSGKRNRLGDFAMRGLSLAASALEERDPGSGRLGFPRPFQLMVRDDASQAQGAAAGMDALTQAGVIAVVGPDDGRSVARAARRAGELGVPLVSLHPAAELLEGIDSPFVFHAVHSAEQRARALARQALAAGMRDFAIFAPDNGYGRKVGDAFRQAVERGGGNVVVEERYPAGSTSFAAHIEKLRKPFQALFVPDRARTLELVAPALAAGNLIARPPGQKVKRGRTVWLLSTADVLEPRFLRSAGRYSVGALLAPGFYADRTDPRIGEFVAQYERSFGRAPTALDAYAFDAAWAVRAAVERGAQNRREVADALATGAVDGLTGKIAFDSSHRRRDDGILFEVVEVRAGQYELRARR